MKWIGYLACFLLGVVVTSGAYEVSGMVTSVSALTAAPDAASADARPRTTAPRATVRPSVRRPDQLMAIAPGVGPMRPDVAVTAQLQSKIASLSPEEKIAIKERRKARKREHRRPRTGLVGAPGATPIALAMPGEEAAGTLDTAAPPAAPTAAPTP